MKVWMVTSRSCDNGCHETIAVFTDKDKANDLAARFDGERVVEMEADVEWKDMYSYSHYPHNPNCSAWYNTIPSLELEAGHIGDHRKTKGHENASYSVGRGWSREEAKANAIKAWEDYIHAQSAK